MDYKSFLFLIKKILKKLFYIFFYKIIPPNKYIDYLIFLYRFVIAHKRLPKRKYTFNDEIFFLSVSNIMIDPLITFTTDKEYGKIFIKSVIGDKYIVKTFAILNSKLDIDNYNFPSRCIVKATHSCNMTQMLTEGTDVNRNELYNWLDYNYYNYSREKNYKNLEKKIIVEEIVFDSTEVLDFRFFINDKKIKFIILDFDTLSERTRLIYDENWNELNFSLNYPKSSKNFPKPKNFDEMCEVVTKLASYFAMQVRIDVYSNGKEIKIGEFSLLHGTGLQQFVPKKAELDHAKLFFN